jgi:phosphoribosylformylglycinamidine synthase
VAHGEGRYFAKEKEIEELEKNQQVIYSYCNENGNIHIDHSPNGSTNGIAGICNKERNVFGMMPHPERACSPMLGNTDGRKIFKELFSIN